MWKMIDRVWFSIEGDRRRNLLNYYNILLKLLVLMGQTELLPQAPLLRTRVRLKQHGLLWKKVCAELGWTWKQADIAYTNQSKARGLQEEAQGQRRNLTI